VYVAVMTKSKESNMANKKAVFIAFAIEDESIRNMIKGQLLRCAPKLPQSAALNDLDPARSS
jgi:hypothetical protein